MIDIPFFKNVDETLLQNIKMYKKKYNKGNTIHNQGTVCNCIDIVISGDIVAYSLLKNGTEKQVFFFRKNNIIGANLLFGNIKHYPLNIYATTNCELLHIDKDSIKVLLHDYEFTLNFIKNLSLNSYGMNQKIKMYTQKTLRENIIDYLKLLYVQQKSESVTLTMSKKQLADYLGVQRPSLFRELKKMKDEGLILINNKEIQIISKLF